MSAGVTRRPYQVADESFICDLFCDMRRPEFVPLGLPAEHLEALLADQFRLRQDHYNKIPDSSWEIFEREGESIGYVGLQRTEDEIRVIDIALLESERGQGIGSGYFDELIKISTRDQKALSLFVEVHNPARNLYDRLGFVFRREEGVYVELVRPADAPAP